MERKGAIRKQRQKQKNTPPEFIERIRTRAYYLAKERDFSPNRELDDWLQAEREILKSAKSI